MTDTGERAAGAATGREPSWREPLDRTAAGMGAPGRPMERADHEWHTSADMGWAAAAAAAEPADAGVTSGGLPRRVPLAQLVPGSVARDSSGLARRSPEAVRGLLSAYHRGVQRGRQQSTDDSLEAPESMTTGPNTPGGKEREL
jgi:hypothetical protein